MKQGYHILLFGILAVTFLDSIGSILSRVLNFDYTWLAPISLIIYFGIGFMTARIAELKTVVVISTILGLYDATIGWWISVLLRANTLEPDFPILLSEMIIMVILMASVAVFAGLLGALVMNIIRKQKHKTKL